MMTALYLFLGYLVGYGFFYTVLKPFISKYGFKEKDLAVFALLWPATFTISIGAALAMAFRKLFSRS